MCVVYIIHHYLVSVEISNPCGYGRFVLIFVVLPDDGYILAETRS
jgi:hypothetical protein